MSEKIDPTAMPISADEMRMSILKKEMGKMDGERRAREAEQKKLTAFTDDFLQKQVSGDEIAMVRRLVGNAVKDGKMEAMVYSLPSDLHRQRPGDQQRRSTLAGDAAGQAKEFHDRYQEFGKPGGYKLKAMVINFPGRVPGDIGFFLNWAPPAV